MRLRKTNAVKTAQKYIKGYLTHRRFFREAAQALIAHKLRYFDKMREMLEDDAAHKIQRLWYQFKYQKAKQMIMEKYEQDRLKPKERRSVRKDSAKSRAAHQRERNKRVRRNPLQVHGARVLQSSRARHLP